MSRALKIVLAYDGTHLVGWQRQPTGVSVQLEAQRLHAIPASWWNTAST